MAFTEGFAYWYVCGKSEPKCLAEIRSEREVIIGFARRINRYNTFGCGVDIHRHGCFGGVFSPDLVGRWKSDSGNPFILVSFLAIAEQKGQKLSVFQRGLMKYV